MLLLCLALPAWAAYLRPSSPWNTVDTVATIAFLFFLLIETLADEQQWRFQCRKHALTQAQRLQHPDPDIRRGFLTRGLFRFSRHPNFFAEQCMWWVFYLFAVGALLGEEATAGWWQFGSVRSTPRLHWSIVGAFQLTLLFQGSTWLTEKLSLEKYGNAYRLYQQQDKPFGSSLGIKYLERAWRVAFDAWLKGVARTSVLFLMATRSLTTRTLKTGFPHPLHDR
ncbi:hypothetical protein F1559_004246 [Cyanidiococcus yangmingshanensis]|uniref:Steroid 5-alpha reductase C-terminal domain-containing protein n=1 Tax=Cyanidiococcus yangmingshanensis TaxID=2690220 RepID=A0A7J7IPJ1_9RHOD|nr:hypothetical protein F1559_004246 [Cyanidiococcus yangmingshanensis]